MSTIFFFFVKTELKKPNDVRPTERPIELETLKSNDSQENSKNGHKKKQSYIESLSPQKKRLIGIGLSIFAGICYGQSNTPILYINANDDTASKNKMDFLFSYYTGIFVTSLFYFTLYCIYKKNKPDIYPQIILPGLVSGLFLFLVMS